jgi:hypothetical protein
MRAALAGHGQARTAPVTRDAAMPYVTSSVRHPLQLRLSIEVLRNHKQSAPGFRVRGPRRHAAGSQPCGPSRRAERRPVGEVGARGLPERPGGIGGGTCRCDGVSAPGLRPPVPPTRFGGAGGPEAVGRPALPRALSGVALAGRAGHVGELAIEARAPRRSNYGRDGAVPPVGAVPLLPLGSPAPVGVRPSGVRWRRA